MRLRTATAATFAAALIAGSVLSGCGLDSPGRVGPGDGDPARTVPAHPGAPSSAPPGRAASAPASGPASAQPSPPTRAQVLAAERTHEVTPGAPAAESTAGWWSTPRLAIADFAQAYMNWTAASLTLHLKVLAAISVGAARSAMEMQEARVRADPTAAAGGVASHGRVAAIVPQPGGRAAFIVVSEQWESSALPSVPQDLPPAWHVTLAACDELTPGHWVVSDWEEES